MAAMGSTPAALGSQVEPPELLILMLAADTKQPMKPPLMAFSCSMRTSIINFLNAKPAIDTQGYTILPGYKIGN